MGIAAATARFNRQAFKSRASCWPVTVMAKGYAKPISGAKSATVLRRQRDEQGAGWVQTAQAVINLSAEGKFVPDIGADFTITEAQFPDEIGTVWRCYGLRRGNPATGVDHRCECFRLD